MTNWGKTCTNMCRLSNTISLSVRDRLAEINEISSLACDDKSPRFKQTSLRSNNGSLIPLVTSRATAVRVISVEFCVAWKIEIHLMHTWVSLSLFMQFIVDHGHIIMALICLFLFLISITFNYSSFICNKMCRLLFVMHDF